MGQSEVLGLQSQNEEQVSHSLVEQLIGNINEGTAIINGHQAGALIHTGSQVTTISKAFYHQNLSECKIEPVEVLQVVGAGGQTVPFLGYVSVDISFPASEAGISKKIPTLALVVPNSTYNERVPALIGPNLLRSYAERCRKNTTTSPHGHNISPVWNQVFKAYATHQKFSHPHSGHAKVKSTLCHPVTIGANESLVVWGLSHSTPGFKCKAILEPSTSSGLPSQLTVTPSLVCLVPGKTTCKIPVELTNNSESPISLPPKAVLGELHVVTEVISDQQSSVKEPAQQANSNVDCPVDLQGTPLTKEQKEKVQVLLNDMAHVFARSDTDFGCSSEVQHEIKLTDTQPVKQRCRRVPPGQLEEFREAVKDLLEAGVIRESKGPYSSPIVLVRKKDKALRICVDFRQVNRKIIKDAYPIPRIKETLEALQGSK